MSVQVGQKGIDFAIAPATYPQMVTAGAHFFCRYSKGYGGAVNKFSTKAGEIQAAARLGADFFANFELNEHTPELGAAAGTKHGNADRLFWNARGLAPKAGVIISWEPGTPQPALEPKVAAFCAAYQKAIGRPIGGYMPLGTMLRFRKSGLIQFTWLPMSAYASGINTAGANTQAKYAALMEKVAADNGINMCQNRNRWYGVGADENKFITMNSTPFSHLQALVQSKPPVTPPGGAMATTNDDLHQDHQVMLHGGVPASDGTVDVSHPKNMDAIYDMLVDQGQTLDAIKAALHL